MRWNYRNLFEEDCTLDVLADGKPSPFVKFLQYLITSGGKYNLLVKVTRKKNKTRLHEIEMTFGNMQKQVLSLEELHLMNYQEWMDNPVLFLDTLAEFKPFQLARARYNRAKTSLDSLGELLNLDTRGQPPGHVQAKRAIKERVQEYEQERRIALRMGAFFPERMRDIYRDYLDTQALPHQEPSSTQYDHIEVELLTVLADEEIAPEIKKEADETLIRYREQKEPETMLDKSQKDNQALIAIKTIQEHYLK